MAMIYALNVPELSPEQDRLFREMVNIHNSNLIHREKFDLLDAYWGIDPVLDDIVRIMQAQILQEWMAHTWAQ